MFNHSPRFRVANILLLSATALSPCFSAVAQSDVERDEYERESTDRDAYRTFDDYSYGPKVGDWEVTLAGGGTSDNDFENNVLNLNLDASTYFRTDLSWGIRQGVTVADTPAGSSYNGTTSVFGQYHFGAADSRLRPFVGARLGYLYGDDTEDSFIAGPEAGLRYYVKPEAFLFGRVNYDFLFESGDDASDQFDDGRFVYTVGVGFTF